MWSSCIIHHPIESGSIWRNLYNDEIVLILKRINNTKRYKVLILKPRQYVLILKPRQYFQIAKEQTKERHLSSYYEWVRI